MKAPPMTASIKEAQELKPCPFCGGPATLTGLPNEIVGGVACRNEECFGPRTTALTKQDSIQQWNTRATPASLSCGEARERIARIIHGDDKNFDELKDIASSHGPYNHYREFLAELYAKADAILATGCVPDEASIRDKREKIARMIRRAMIDNPTGGTSEERAAKRASIADEYATAYLADLATGCVPGEAERIRHLEDLLKRVLALGETGGWRRMPDRALFSSLPLAEDIAAAIRAGRGEG